MKKIVCDYITLDNVLLIIINNYIFRSDTNLVVVVNLPSKLKL